MRTQTLSYNLTDELQASLSLTNILQIIEQIYQAAHRAVRRKNTLAFRHEYERDHYDLFLIGEDKIISGSK